MAVDVKESACKTSREEMSFQISIPDQDNKSANRPGSGKAGLFEGQTVHSRKSSGGENVINALSLSARSGLIDSKGDTPQDLSMSSHSEPQTFSPGAQYWETMKLLIGNRHSDPCNSNLISIWSAWMQNACRNPHNGQANYINQYWTQLTERWNAVMKGMDQAGNGKVEHNQEALNQLNKKDHILQEQLEHAIDNSPENKIAKNAQNFPSPITIPDNQFNFHPSPSPRSAPAPGTIRAMAPEYRPWSAPRLTQVPSFQFPSGEALAGSSNYSPLQEDAKTSSAHKHVPINDKDSEKFSDPATPQKMTANSSYETLPTNHGSEEQNRKFMDELRRRFSFQQPNINHIPIIPTAPLPPYDMINTPVSSNSPIFYPPPTMAPYYLRLPSDPNSPLSDPQTPTFSSDSPGVHSSPKPPSSRRSRTRGSAIDSVHAAIVREAKEQFKGLDPENMYIQCPICQKRIKRLYHFQRHMRIHTGEKTHQCPFCQYKSVRKDNLKSHMKTHEKQTIENGRRSTKSSYQHIRERESFNTNGVNRHPARSRACFPQSQPPPLLFNSSTDNLGLWKDGLAPSPLPRTSPYSFYPFSSGRNFPWLQDKPQSVDPLYNLSSFNLLKKNLAPTSDTKPDRLSEDSKKYNEKGGPVQGQGEVSLKNEAVHQHSISVPSNSVNSQLKRSHDLANLLQSPLSGENGKRLRIDFDRRESAGGTAQPNNLNNNNNKNGRSLNLIEDFYGKPTPENPNFNRSFQNHSARGTTVEHHQTKTWLPEKINNTSDVEKTSHLKHYGDLKRSTPHENNKLTPPVETYDPPKNARSKLSPKPTDEQCSGLAKSLQGKGCVPIKREYEPEKTAPIREDQPIRIKTEPLSFRHDPLLDVIDNKQIENGCHDLAADDVRKVAHAFAAFSPEGHYPNDENAAKELTCRLCAFRFQNSGDLQAHMGLVHKQDGFYKCDECNYLGKNLSKLVEHIRIHTGERPFKCDQCSYAAKRKDNLAQHKAVRHDKRKTRPNDIYSMIDQIGANPTSWVSGKDREDDRENQPRKPANRNVHQIPSEVTPAPHFYPQLHPLPTAIFQYPFYMPHPMLHPSRINPSLVPGVVASGADGFSNPNSYSLKVRAALISP